MIIRNQLAYKLNAIVYIYNKNKNVERFYNNTNNLNSLISFYIRKDLYDEYKIYNLLLCNNIINCKIDETVINDFINIIRKILIALLVFE
jgi:hypothetical protein